MITSIKLEIEGLTLTGDGLRQAIFITGVTPQEKDGTWRMCVDYIALNVVTVKDRFPLSTVDKLLNELGSARVFFQTGSYLRVSLDTVTTYVA
ncbi:RNA-directed DNA polymerase [Trifolium pratense]|uniref:RNA-directed DNA polymerase n=1 Tax=Trifolium pratense TaxID=57577 RepID=A0A2K3LHX2_TRIPR|nr:RNA-directed DNA polymerase [Trifolium pratense]